ncbi:MAG: M20/M25/M40 family metallo-hydrolase, partial [Sphingobacteriaceae bacterium]
FGFADVVLGLFVWVLVRGIVPDRYTRQRMQQTVVLHTDGVTVTDRTNSFHAAWEEITDARLISGSLFALSCCAVCTTQGDFILRDFDEDKLHHHAEVLKQIANEVLQHYPASGYSLKITPQYRNMKAMLDKHPEIVAYGMEAIKRAGLDAKLCSIRGGTDGSRLSFMGLPCPNIFAGEHAFHSKQEWVSVQDMQKAVETILHLCMIWEEQAI